jgi:hypothetical protein
MREAMLLWNRIGPVLSFIVASNGVFSPRAGPIESRGLAQMQLAPNGGCGKTPNPTLSEHPGR